MMLRDAKGRFVVDIAGILRRSRRFGIVPWIFILGCLVCLIFLIHEQRMRPTRAEMKDEFIAQRVAYDNAYRDVARKADFVGLAQKDDLTNLGLKMEAGLADLQQNLRSDLVEKPSKTNVRDLLNQVSAQVSAERLTRVEVSTIVQDVVRAEFASQREAYDRAYQDVARRGDLVGLGLKIDLGLVDFRLKTQNDLLEKPSGADVPTPVHQVSDQISEERLTRSDVQGIVCGALDDVSFATTDDVQRVLDKVGRAFEELRQSRRDMNSTQHSSPCLEASTYRGPK